MWIADHASQTTKRSGPSIFYIYCMGKHAMSWYHSHASVRIGTVMRVLSRCHATNWWCFGSWFGSWRGVHPKIWGFAECIPTWCRPACRSTLVDCGVDCGPSWISCSAQFCYWKSYIEYEGDERNIYTHRPQHMPHTTIQAQQNVPNLHHLQTKYPQQLITQNINFPHVCPINTSGHSNHMLLTASFSQKYMHDMHDTNAAISLWHPAMFCFVYIAGCQGSQLKIINYSAMRRPRKVNFIPKWRKNSADFIEPSFVHITAV